jgi:hypothetical protein
VTIATSAGLQLDDWDLAFSLLDQLKPPKIKMQIMQFYLESLRLMGLKRGES